jgi:DNA polymerase (family X)
LSLAGARREAGVGRTAFPLYLPDVTLTDKAAVAQVLRNISLLLQIKGENAFKSRAYDLGADRIAGLTQDLGEVVASGKLEELPGIGEALAKKIVELVQTGKLAYYEQLKAEYPTNILELLKVPDLGPKKAALLWKELQISDVDSLEQACLGGRVKGLKGFGAKTEQKLLEGIAMLRRAGGRKLLGAVLPRAQGLLEAVLKAPGVVRASIGGSVRRSRETVADVDLIASAPDPEPVFDAFVASPAVATVIGRGESKCSVRLKEDDLQVDLRVLPDGDFATALHHFTGSKAHHIRLRGLAQDRGLKISEWGVHRGEEKLSVEDEPALYALLGMQFVPPELREDAGEVEAALSGGLPSDLISLEDVRGITHSHSTWSDGRNTLEEMARAALARGYTYLTVTEHSEAAFYARGLDEKRVREQWAEVDRLNAELKGIRLIKGIEADILESGELDLPRALLEEAELVIGSIHTRHQMDEDKMTLRVLKALDHPCLHMLGHPTGRLLSGRDPYPLRMAEILDRAAERGIIVEVNGNPERLDIKDNHVRLAVERGVKLAVSSDSHSVPELDYVRFAVATARRGWAKKADVVNTLSAEDFLQHLRSMHPRAA